MEIEYRNKPVILFVEYSKVTSEVPEDQEKQPQCTFHHPQLCQGTKEWCLGAELYRQKSCRGTCPIVSSPMECKTLKRSQPTKINGPVENLANCNSAH